MTNINRKSEMVRVYSELKETIALLKKLYLDGYGQPLIEAVHQIDYRLRSGVPFHPQQEQLDRIETAIAQLKPTAAPAQVAAKSANSTQPAPPQIELASDRAIDPTPLSVRAMVRHSTRGIGMIAEFDGSKVLVNFGIDGKHWVERSDLKLREVEEDSA